MNDEEHYCDRDARVGHVEGRPRIGIPNVQIEKEKVDHVSVKEAIGEITQNASKQQCKREVAPCIRLPSSQQQNRYNYQRDNGNYNEESIVALERSERCARVGNVNQTKEIADDNVRLVKTDQTQHQVLTPLVKSVEREREKKNELHLDSVSFRAQRSGVEEPRGSIECYFTGCLNFARHDD